MFDKYLVTGATGFLGRVVAEELVRRKAQVHALVLHDDPYTDLLPKEVRTVIGDVCDKSSLSDFFADADSRTCVIHCAGIVLNKAKDQGCDVFFAPVSIAYSTQLVSQAASLNIGIPFLGSDTWDDNMVLQAAKGTNVQVFVSTFYAEGGNKTFDDGIKAYINSNADAKTTNGGDDTISAVTAMGYDVYYVALEALKAAGSTDPAKVMEALPGVTYDGVSGHIAFDETGDAIRDTAYIKTIDTAANVWKFVTQQKAS